MKEHKELVNLMETYIGEDWVKKFQLENSSAIKETKFRLLLTKYDILNKVNRSKSST